MSNEETYVGIMQEVLAKAKQNNTFFQADFELTARCNFNCKFCYVSNSLLQNKEELSTNQWKQIFDQCIEIGVLCCEFTGGEAITRSDYAELYKYAYDSGLRIAVLSNGYAITKYIDLYKTRAPEVISITLYGGGDETYKRICGVKNGYTIVTQNICELVKAGIAVTLKIVASPDISEDEYKKVSEFAKELNIPIVLVKYISPMRTKEKDMNMEWRLSAKEINRIDQYFEKEDVQVSHCPSARSRMFDCGFAKTRFAVSHKGELFGCLACTGFSEQIDFQETIISKLKKIRLAAEEESRKITVCKDCAIADKCGKCPGLNYSETGQFNECTKYMRDLVDLQII